MCRIRTRRTIGSRLASARTITRKAAFVIGIQAGADVFANAVITVAFLGVGASHARVRAYIAAAKPIRAIIRDAVRGRRTSDTIVVLARSGPGTPAIDAFVFGIQVIRDGSTRPVCPAAFFRCCTCLAQPRTRGIATDAIHTIARRALCTQRTRRTIGLWHLDLIACARAATFARIAFVIGISAAGDSFANAVVTVPFFRVGTRHTRTGADVAAAIPVGAIVRETLVRRGTRSAIVVAANAAATAPAGAAFLVWIGIRSDVSTRAIHTATFFRGRTCRATAGTGRVATNAIDAIA